MPGPVTHTIYSVFGHALREPLGRLYQQLETLTASLALADAVPNLPRSDLKPSPDTPSPPTPPPDTPGPDDLLEQAPDIEPATFQNRRNVAGTFAALCRLSALPGAETSGADDVAQALGNRLNEPQRQALQLVSAIIGRLPEESGVPGELKPFLQQWQQPLLKQAIRDPQIFDDSSHPVRRMIDALGPLALAMDDGGGVGSKLRAELAQWTNRLVRDNNATPELLEQAAAALETLGEPWIRGRALRLNRLREACEGKQRIHHAHASVNAETLSRLAGQTVPRIVVELLERGWRQWLILAHLREGTDGQEWREGWNAVDQLLAWLAPGGKLPPLEEARRLLARIEERLATVCTDHAAYRHLVDDMARFLLEGGQPERVTVSAARAKTHEPESPRQAKQFQLGDWLRFQLAPGQPAAPLCIAWIGEKASHFAFADHKGNKRLELEAGEFVRYLESGRAERMDSLERPLSERTLVGLLEAQQEKLRHQASHDGVTGLLNRKAFLHRLEREPSDQPHFLCVVEIDQFRVINHVCGSEAGDRLLGDLAALLKADLAPDDPAARLGDHQFGILFRRCSEAEGLGRAEHLRDSLRVRHFIHGERSFAIDLHIGIAVFRVGRHTPDEALKNANAACLRAIEIGVNQIQTYEEGDRHLIAQEQLLNWAGRLDSLLREHRLFSRCQMIAPISGQEGAAHYEILLGVRDEQGKPRPPAEFIAAAEHWKQMTEIDRWQVDSTFSWIRQHPARFAALGGFSINLSGQSLNSAEFLEFLRQRLAEADWPLNKIIFEITETAAIAEFGRAERFIREIKRYGCRFSLDDFGSGFSSYGYLKNLQADYLKIDGIFVRDLTPHSSDYAMVKSMNEIGHSLGMKTIAEYVESAEILDQLKDISVDYAQGYYIGKPIPLNELEVPGVVMATAT